VFSSRFPQCHIQGLSLLFRKVNVNIIRPASFCIYFDGLWSHSMLSIVYNVCRIKCSRSVSKHINKSIAFYPTWCDSFSDRRLEWRIDHFSVEIAAAAAYAPTSCRNSFTVFSFAFEYIPVASLRRLVFSHVLSRSFFSQLNLVRYPLVFIRRSCLYNVSLSVVKTSVVSVPTEVSSRIYCLYSFSNAHAA
jgi:hypothetical protein